MAKQWRIKPGTIAKVEHQDAHEQTKIITTDGQVAYIHSKVGRAIFEQVDVEEEGSTDSGVGTAPRGSEAGDQSVAGDATGVREHGHGFRGEGAGPDSGFGE